MHIHNKPASQRTHVLESQAQRFALLAEQLTRIRQALSLDESLATPEYIQFSHAGYACGLVCSDYKPISGNKFMVANLRPNEHLADCSFRDLRHWVHHLFRAERWADGLSSPILEAINSGALTIVATRLKNDNRLRESEVVILDEANI